MGIPAGYRPSIDAGSPTDPYPEQPYSPTEPMSGGRKRTFSQFDGRNPFAQSPNPNRDRITSLGGYSIHQGPSGGRGSIALAPDQQLTDISPTAKAPSVDLTKPFWAQDTDVEHPKIKATEEDSGPVGDGWKGDSLFSASAAHLSEYLLKLMSVQLYRSHTWRLLNLAKVTRNCPNSCQQVPAEARLRLHFRSSFGLWLQS